MITAPPDGKPELPALPRPEWHPLVPFLSEAEIDALLDREDGFELYQDAFRAHAGAVRAADYDESQPLSTNPVRDGFELPHWAETDVLLGRVPRLPTTIEELVENWRRAPYVQTFRPELRSALGHLPEPLLQESFYIWIGLGGNRSGKTEYCAKRVVMDALKHPNAFIVCLSETLDSGVINQQHAIWKYLPPNVKKLNNVTDKRGVFNIRYSKKGGFTKETLILPNGSTIMFKSYVGDSKDVEGWMLGSKTGRCVGMWLDESADTDWFEAGQRRCRYCGAILLWSFTPIHGMTTAIHEAVGEAETVMSLPAELLSPEIRHVADCPPGHVPYLQRARTRGAIVQYFHSQFNPFGTAAGTFYSAVKSLCFDNEGQPRASAIIKRLAYGHAENTLGRKFSHYCSVHVVKVKNLPSVGCVYQFTDPHGSRPYATIWVLVTPGNPPNYYVIRDWPDEKTYDKWAEPTKRKGNDESRKGLDGDPGPAQRELGLGVIAYKKLWADTERIRVPAEIVCSVRPVAGEVGPEGQDYNVSELLEAKVKYPWHRRAIREALRDEVDLETLTEFVAERFMDSRFCNSEHASEHGGKCLRDYFEEEQRTPEGKLLGPAYLITPASGKDIEHGCGLLTDLLSYDKERELIPHINAPHLWVSEECTQVRWALENYTGRAGESGACKEWIDLLRHLAEAAPMYVNPGLLKVTGGGSY